MQRLRSISYESIFLIHDIVLTQVHRWACGYAVLNQSGAVPWTRHGTGVVKSCDHQKWHVAYRMYVHSQIDRSYLDTCTCVIVSQHSTAMSSLVYTCLTVLVSLTTLSFVKIASSEYLTQGFRPPSVPLVVIDPYIRYARCQDSVPKAIPLCFASCLVGYYYHCTIFKCLHCLLLI